MSPSRILIVDDLEENRYPLRRILEKEGHEIVECSSGEGALELVRSSTVDLVLLDIRMPKKSGFDVCREIKEHNQTIPIVFVTANYRDYRDQIKGFDVGGDDYVLQPYDNIDLMTRIKAILRTKAICDQLMNQIETLKGERHQLVESNETLRTINKKLDEKGQFMERLVVTDNLTSLFNKKYFLDALRKEIKAVQRYNVQVSCALIDVDDFKNINNTFGSSEGDAVLKEIASVMVSNLRESDIIARYDQGTFGVIFTHTDEQGAYLKSEMIRQSIESHRFIVFERQKEEGSEEKETTIRLTVSMGISSFPNDFTESVEDVIKNADICLGEAKKRSKNTVVCASDLDRSVFKSKA